MGYLSCPMASRRQSSEIAEHDLDQVALFVSVPVVSASGRLSGNARALM